MKHTRMRGEQGSRSSTPAGTIISHRKETQIAIQFKMQTHTYITQKNRYTNTGDREESNRLEEKVQLKYKMNLV